MGILGSGVESISVTFPFPSTQAHIAAMMKVSQQIWLIARVLRFFLAWGLLAHVGIEDILATRLPA